MAHRSRHFALPANANSHYAVFLRPFAGQHAAAQKFEVIAGRATHKVYPGAQLLLQQRKQLVLPAAFLHGKAGGMHHDRMVRQIVKTRVFELFGQRFSGFFRVIFNIGHIGHFNLQRRIVAGHQGHAFFL